MLAFIGITDPEVIVAEGLLMGPPHSEAEMSRALEKAAGIAAS